MSRFYFPTSLLPFLFSASNSPPPLISRLSYRTKPKAKLGVDQNFSQSLQGRSPMRIQQIAIKNAATSAVSSHPSANSPFKFQASQMLTPNGSNCEAGNQPRRGCTPSTRLTYRNLLFSFATSAYPVIIVVKISAKVTPTTTSVGVRATVMLESNIESLR